MGWNVRSGSTAGATVMAVLALAGCGSAASNPVAVGGVTTSAGIELATGPVPPRTAPTRVEDVLVSLDEVPPDIEDRLRDARFASRACTALAQDIVGQYVLASASPRPDRDITVGDISAESRRRFPHRPGVVEAITGIGRRYGRQVFVELRNLELPPGAARAQRTDAMLRITTPANVAVAMDCRVEASLWGLPRTTSP